MTTRYFTHTGSNPDIQASFHMSGPQAEDQIPVEVRQLLNREGIHTVAVLYNHGQGERIEVFQPMKDREPETTESGNEPH